MDTVMVVVVTVDDIDTLPNNFYYLMISFKCFVYVQKKNKKKF